MLRSSAVALSALTTMSLVVAQQWEEVRPGGDTVCGRGAAYRFHFRPGSVNKLVIDFQGGGGCWDAVTCLLPTWGTTAGGPPGNSGLVSTTNAENPTLNWNYLYIPYCTGDVHLGDGEIPGTTFAGRANARAALEWVYGRMREPEVVLTTGCSAGALGADLWAAHVASHYVNSRNVLFGDSYVGVTNANHWATLQQNWDLLGAVRPAPGLMPGDLREFRENICPYMLERTAAAFPAMEFGQFTYNNDAVQTAFTLLAGGPLDWSPVMRRIMPTVAEQPNSAYFIADGAGHCTITGNGMYNAQAEGTRLVDWMSQLIERRPVEQVIDCCGDANRTAAVSQKQPAPQPSLVTLQFACAANFSMTYQQRHGPVKGAVAAPLRERIVRAYKSYCGALAMDEQ